MKLIITPLGSYLTGDEIADALLDYGHALARNQTTDLVDIPVVVEKTTRRLRLTVGWMVQLQSLETEARETELVSLATTKSLRARTAKLVDGEPSLAWPVQAEADAGTDDDGFFEYGL
ncbi:conserved hypothetical protein [Microbacterium sp. 8M]|uniref:hypothetical protein n=1 Tax=Microbacterium sp. 8M TaxID=2653153 RepID=UPI0012F40F8A|nr:hypothetical protein [Microbacterium sp. 8M]VXC21612.1 conserved hypothetical protein [Microbacterium sp. 8M]